MNGNAMTVTEYLTTYNWWQGVLVLLARLLPPLLADKATFKRLSDFSFVETRRRWIFILVALCYAAFSVVPFFVERPKSIGLLAIGGSVLGFGIVCTIISYANYFSSKPNEAITKGLYRFSRNAMYVSTCFMLIGEVILCRSLVLGVLLVLCGVLQHYVVVQEERFCERQYGESYLAYKKRTPRYFLFF